LFGVRSLAIHLVDGAEKFITSGPLHWAFVDPLFIGFPVAILVTVLVSMVTPKTAEGHLNRCFGRKAG
jgi:hypothetical protein